MNISTSMLIEKLEQYNPKLLAENSKNISIKSAKMLEIRQTIFEPDSIYIARIADFNKIMTNTISANFLLISTGSSDLNPQLDVNGNIILIVNNEDICKIFNKIQYIISLYVNWSTNLLESLFKDKGLSHILYIGQELLHNSLQLIDTSFSLLAYTNDLDVDDEEWNENIKYGYFKYKNVEQLKVGKYIERLFKSAVPIIIHPPFYKNRLLMSNIIIDCKIVGHLTINEGKRTFIASDIKLVTFLTDIISSELNKDKFYQNSNGIMHENLISGLLSNKITDPIVIEEKTRILGLDPKKNLHVLAFVSDKEDIANTPFHFIKNTLDLMIVGSKSTIYNDHIVMIVEQNKEELFSKEFLSNLESFLSKNMLRCGFNRPFDNLAHIRKYYAQCLTAIEFGVYLKRTRFLYPYEEYAIYYTFKMCMNTIDLKDLCHSAVLNLIEYDRKNSTKYTLSLYTYLQTALNITDSAKRLYIHHNTMRFRIKKIESILDVTLDNGSLLQKMDYSFKVLEFLGELESLM